MTEYTNCGHVRLDSEDVVKVHTVISEDDTGWVVSNEDRCSACAEDLVDGITCFDDWDTLEATLRENQEVLMNEKKPV